MAIYDVENMFSDDQAITTTAASTNYIDLGPGFDRNIGPGEPIKLEVQVTTGFTTSTETLTVSLQTDDNTSFSSATTLATSAAIPASSMTSAGYKINVTGTVPDTGVERYLRLYYTCSATLAAGIVQGAFALDTQTN